MRVLSSLAQHWGNAFCSLTHVRVAGLNCSDGGDDGNVRARTAAAARSGSPQSTSQEPTVKIGSAFYEGSALKAPPL